MIKKLGKFSTSGKLILTDPCYRDSKDWLELDVKAGTWFSEVRIKRCGDFGMRITELLMYHSSLKKLPTDLRMVGSIGVDSGQVGAFDSELVGEIGVGEYNESGTFYGGCCAITLSKRNGGSGILDSGLGVVSSSGMGDGSYVVYGYSDSLLKIVFIK